MDLHPILEVLGIERLDSLSSKDLKSSIKHAASAGVSRNQVLGASMGWLHEQIKKDAITQHMSMPQEFVDMLLKPDTLDIVPFLESEIELAFSEWQERDAKENPANRRRYMMAKLDIHRLLMESKSGFQLENGPPSSDSLGQAGGEERVALSCKTNMSPFLIESQDKDLKDYEPRSGKKKTGSNGIPLGTRNPFRVASNQEVIDICEDDEPAQQENAATSHSSDLDEVTITRETIILDSPLETMPKSIERSKPSKQRHGRKLHSSGSDFALPPPLNYVCNRCSEPGHWIQLCPTNLDPSYDKPPEPHYRCELCGQIGDHFATLCPRNQKAVSLTKQRQRIATRSQTPQWEEYHQRRSGSPVDRYHRSDHDIYRPDRSPRARYEEPNRYTRRKEDYRDLSPYSARVHLTRERERERERKEVSPRRLHSDNYRPQDRSLSPPRVRWDLTTPPAKILNLRKDSKRPGNESREGRLAYDDDIDVFMEPYISRHVSSTKNAPKQSDDIIKNDNMKSASPIVNDTPEDIEKAREEADIFLNAFAVELMSAAKTNSSDDPMDTDEAHSYSDGCDSVAEPDSSTFPGSDGSRTRLTQESQFKQEVVALFTNRDNHIVHDRTNRKTACEMMTSAACVPQVSSKGPVNPDRSSSAPSTSHQPKVILNVRSPSLGG